MTAEMRASLLEAGNEAAKATNTLKLYQRELAATREAALKNADGQHAVSGMSAQNSAALKNLSFQLNDIATGFATGQPPMMIFAQQGSQVVQALQMMEGGSSKVVSFLSGPWGMALTAATVVVAPFIAKLIDAKSAAEENAEAMDKVKLADDGVGDAQRVLGQMYDLATGKLKDQNEEIALNIRLKEAQMRADAAAAKDRASKAFNSADGALGGVMGPVSTWTATKGVLGAALGSGNPDSKNLFDSLGGIDDERRRGTELRDVIAKVRGGKMPLDQASKWAQSFKFKGLPLDEAGFQQALADLETSKVLPDTADKLSKSLESGKLDKSFMQTSKKKGAGPSNTSQWEEEWHQREMASGEFFKDNTAEELKFWQGKLALTKDKSKERLEVEKHIYDASKTLAQQDYQNQLAALRDKIEADRNNWSLVQADKEKELTLIKNTFGEKSAEYSTAHRELEKLEREHQERELQAAQQHSARLIEKWQRQMDARFRASNDNAKTKDENVRSKAGLSMFGDVGAEVAVSQNHQSAIAEQMVANEEFYQKQSDKLNEQIAAAQAVYGDDKAKYQNLLDAKEQADQKYRDRKESLDAQAHEQQIAAIQAIKAAYHGYVDGIVSSSVSAFDGLISGQKTWAQAGIGIYQSVVQTAERRFAQMVSNWIVDHLSMKAVAAVTAQADAASHGAAQTAKTGATLAGVTARSSIEMSARLAVAPALAASVVQHSAAEAAKTGATATGAAIRTGTEVAGSAKSVAISATSALARVGHSAAVAAAGAYAAIAAIPVVGPVLAPMVAAGALAGVLMLGKSIMSAEGGMGDVPYDDAPFLLHKNEMVLPADIASPLRSQIKSGGAFGGANKTNENRNGDMHVTYAPTINGHLPFADQLDQHESNIIAMLQRAHRRGALKFAR